MKSGKLYYIFYVILVTVGCLLVIELVSQKINSTNGINIPFFLETRFHTPGGKNALLTFDPHLGYAHGQNEKHVKNLSEKYSWIDGFAVYSKRSISNLQRPVILALGGSTTDGVKYDHSWPEELAKLLVQEGKLGTVVNGGTAGYSTNQELLKLIRDGLTFTPDIIISYSGVNDRGHHGGLPYPMVHPYQRSLLEYLTRPAHSPVFPNTIYLLNQMLWGNRPGGMTVTLGVPNSGSLGQQFERNMVLMAAIAHACGATFYGIIQPNAYVSSGRQSGITEASSMKGGKGAKYVSELKDLYGQINQVPQRLSFVYSFTSIFDGEDQVYTDGVHATVKGDRLIAEKVLDLIDPDLTSRKTGAAGHKACKL